LVTDSANKPEGIGRVEWKVGSQYGGLSIKCLFQCLSWHTTAAGIESVKEKYFLFHDAKITKKQQNYKKDRGNDIIYKIFIVILHLA